LLMGCVTDVDGVPAPGRKSAEEDSEEDAELPAAGAGAAESTKQRKLRLKAQLEKDIAELKAKPKPKFQTADAWDVHVRGQIDGLNQAFRLACEGGSMILPGQADMASLQDALQSSLEDEVEQLQALLPVSSAEVALWKQECGDPLDAIKMEKRYCFWPDREDALPLLFLCAKMLLGTRLNAIPNEQLHSAAGLIFTLLRSRLHPAKAERLTLARQLLMGVLKEDKRLIALDKLRDAEDGMVDGDAAVSSLTVADASDSSDEAEEAGDAGWIASALAGAEEAGSAIDLAEEPAAA